MQIPIPDDYDAESGLTCFAVWWPDTPYWIGILQGLITSIQQGRLWDAKTGSIKAVQAIGREVEAATLPLATCADCDNQTGDNEVTCPACGGAVVIEDNYEMPVTRIVPIDADGREIPYDDNTGRSVAGMRWYMGECCPHDIYFGAQGEGGSVVVPPGEDPVEFPTLGTGTACSKVTAWTNVLFAAMDSLFDDILVPETPDVAIAHVKALRYDVNWGDFDLLRAYGWAAQIHAFGYINEMEDPRVQQNIKCALVDAVDDGSQGISKAEYENMLELLVDYCRSEFTVWAYPTAFHPMIEMYQFTAQAIGAGDTEKLTTGTVSAASDDCDCGGAPGVDDNPDWVDEGDWYIVLDMQGNLPGGVVMHDNNGTSYITSRGCELGAEFTGGRKTGLEFWPAQTGGIVERVKFEMLWGAGQDWLNLGLHSSFGGNYLQDPAYFDVVHDPSTGIATYENTALSVTLDGMKYILAEITTREGQDPHAPVFARVIMQGTGPHPWGL